jgi:glycosyltransferase involved in cell wall biosynthesis
VTETTPPKVLHCVERMHTNSIETWLARMHRHALETGCAIDWYFHVQLDVPGSLEDRFPECRPRILRSPCPLSQWAKFFAAFWQICRAGRFDVVHIHADLMSAPYAVLARLAGVRTILVHVHNADENIPAKSRLKRRILQGLFRHICLRLADRIVGNSHHTLDTFLAGRKRRPGCDLVHYCGVDPTPVKSADGDRLAFRRTLGLADDCRIFLFAGRMVPEKNPLFAVEVFAELNRLDPAAAAVFAGSGSLEEAVCQCARQHGLQAAFRHLGWRNDIAAIMRCCDWFILPRLEHPMEGFGIAVVEAQLASLRLLLSDGIADDPLLPTACYRRLLLAAGAKAWAAAAMELIEERCPSSTEAMVALAASPMAMNRAFRDLTWLHA